MKTQAKQYLRTQGRGDANTSLLELASTYIINYIPIIRKK